DRDPDRDEQHDPHDGRVALRCSRWAVHERPRVGMLADHLEPACDSVALAGAIVGSAREARGRALARDAAKLALCDHADASVPRMRAEAPCLRLPPSQSCLRPSSGWGVAAYRSVLGATAWSRA